MTTAAAAAPETSRGTFDLYRRDYDTLEDCYIPTPCTRFGPFAILKREGSTLGHWEIYHAATGRCCRGGFLRRRDAIATARAILDAHGPDIWAFDLVEDFERLPTSQRLAIRAAFRDQARAHGAAY